MFRFPNAAEVAVMIRCCSDQKGPRTFRNPVFPPEKGAIPRKKESCSFHDINTIIANHY